MIEMKEIFTHPPQNPCTFENPFFFKARFWKKSKGFRSKKARENCKGKKAWIQNQQGLEGQGRKSFKQQTCSRKTENAKHAKK